MGLTSAQRAIVERIRLTSVGDQSPALSDAILIYLIAIVVRDLQLDASFPELPAEIPAFYSSGSLLSRRVENLDFLALYERLLRLNSDADTYLLCLAALHKARMKYERILQSQPFPTMDQVGPRCLLQYGSIAPGALAALLFWRKWFFDIDNRAAQETGYLFEPILANAMGGTPAPANKSPIRRLNDPGKGRQVDCIRAARAYEFKLRVTTAASGQGRWKEELDFPADCRSCNYTPVLIVLDGTENPKLRELRTAYLSNGGEVYTGEAAWGHLRLTAGQTMGQFIEKYVSEPIRGLLAESPSTMPELRASVSGDVLTLSLLNQQLSIKREPAATGGSSDAMPEDADQQLPGA
jgi:hypothetical protein